MTEHHAHCKSCGTAWVDHLGVEGLCAKLRRVEGERDRLRELLERCADQFDMLDTIPANAIAGVIRAAGGEDE